MTITTLIFDFDGVMSGYDAPARLSALSRFTGVDGSEIFRRIWESGFEDDAEAGLFDDGDAYLAAFSERLGANLSRQEWIAARAEAMTHWPDMHDLVRKLSDRYRIALLTNNGPLTRMAFADLAPHTASLFGSSAYFSYQFGTKKPDPGIFEAVASRLDVKPHDCAFIDDKPRNVTGATQTGMAALHFTGTDILRRDLARLDIAGPIS